MVIVQKFTKFGAVTMRNAFSTIEPRALSVKPPIESGFDS
jgi:hypothetical protein